jgi:hypothetical protein
MSMKKVTKVILFFVVFVLHWGTQFLAWASADAIRSTNVAHLLWRVLATPLLEIAGSAMNEILLADHASQQLSLGNGADLVFDPLCTRTTMTCASSNQKRRIPGCAPECATAGVARKVLTDFIEHELL